MNVKKILPIVAIIIAIPMFIIGIFYKDRTKTVKKSNTLAESVLTQEEIDLLQMKASNYDSIQERLKQMATKICQRIGVKEEVEKVDFYSTVYYDTYEEFSYTAWTKSYTIIFKGYDDDITITNNSVYCSNESSSNDKSKEDIAKDLINKYDFLSDYDFIKLDDSNSQKNIAIYSTKNRDSNNNLRPDIYLQFDDNKEIMYNAQLKYEEVFCNNEVIITAEEAKQIAKEAVKNFAVYRR